MYTIKSTPQDFIVEEVLEYEPFEQGNYVLCKLKKTNYSTFDAIKRVSDFLGIRVADIKYAGVKDKVGVTIQYLSIKDAKHKKHIEHFKDPDIELTYVARIKEPLYMGALKANKFTITLRDVDKPLVAIDRAPNYFGEQRFSQHNVAIARLILQKEYVQAANLCNHAQVQAHLEKTPKDGVGALHQLPSRLLKLIMSSVQSLWFNEMLAKHITNGSPVSGTFGNVVFGGSYSGPGDLPIIGFDTDVNDIIMDILSSEGFSPRSFIQKPVPEATLYGGSRQTFVEVSDCEVGELKDGVQEVSFTLPKGSYATMILREMYFKQKA